MITVADFPQGSHNRKKTHVMVKLQNCVGFASQTMNECLDGGSGIHYSLKIQPIIHLIKILAYSLK